MDKMSSSSLSNSPSKNVAVRVVEGLRNTLFEPGSQKVPFKYLFTALMLHLGNVLFQIVVILSGLLPILVIASHIGGFILERCVEIFSVDTGRARLKKITLASLQISILILFFYFLVYFLYAPIFFVLINFFSTV